MLSPGCIPKKLEDNVSSQIVMCLDQKEQEISFSEWERIELTLGLAYYGYGIRMQKQQKIFEEAFLGMSEPDGV